MGEVATTLDTRTINVAILSQAGNAVGGAERSLATFLKYRPPDINWHFIALEDGSFVNSVRSLGVEADVMAAPPAMLSTPRERVTLRAVAQGVDLAVSLSRLLRKKRIDVLYTNTMKAHFVGAIAARMAGVRCVMHFHDLLAGRWLAALRFAARYGSIEQIACSQLVASSIGAARTSVIFGPIDTAEFEGLPDKREARRTLGLDLDIPVVALIGRINRWKRQDLFLRVADRVSRSKRVQFVVVGSPVFRDSEFLTELHTLAEHLQIENSVTFLPWVDDVRGVYAAIDVNVNCSLREPFGRTSGEAAAAGIPSVVFDDSGIAEVLNEHAGRIVPANDEAAFAAAIIELLDAQPPSSEAVVAIKRAARPFDAVTVSQSIASVIRKAASA